MEPIDTILLIDDADTSCFIAEKLLERSEIARNLITVHSGEEALALLKEYKENIKKLPEVILLDIDMVALDSIAFLENLVREHLPLSNCKIFLIGSANQLPNKQKYPISIAGYIKKPLTKKFLYQLW